MKDKTYDPHNKPAIGTVIMSVSQMRQLRLGEAKEPVHGHTASRWQTRSRIEAVNPCLTRPLAVCEHGLLGEF